MPPVASSIGWSLSQNWEQTVHFSVITRSWSSADVSNVSHTEMFSSLSFSTIHFSMVSFCTESFLVGRPLHSAPRSITELSSKLHILPEQRLFCPDTDWKMSGVWIYFEHCCYTKQVLCLLDPFNNVGFNKSLDGICCSHTGPKTSNSILSGVWLVFLNTFIAVSKCSGSTTSHVLQGKGC